MNLILEQNEENPIIKEAKKRSLINYISIREVQTLVRCFQNGQWQQPQYQRFAMLAQSLGVLEYHKQLTEIEKELAKYMASREKQHRRKHRRNKEEYSDQEELEYQESFNMIFQYEPKRGDRLPQLQISFGYKIGQIMALIHIQDDRWIDNNTEQFFDCCQKMILRNREKWFGKVRVVAVSNYGITSPILKENWLRKWSQLEHIQLIGKPTLVDLLVTGKQISILLIDQNGLIDSFSRVFDISLEERIWQLIQSRNKIEIWKNDMVSKQIKCNQFQWKNLKKLVMDLPEVPLQDHISLSVSRFKNYEFGVQKRKLKLKIEGDQEKNTYFKLFANQMTKGLHQDFYQVLFQHQDKQKLIDTEFKSISSILKKYGIQKEPIISSTGSWNLNQQDFLFQKRLCHPRLIYKQDLTYETCLKIIQEQEQIGLSSRALAVPNISTDFFPFIIGHKFQGINGLKGTDLCHDENIQHKKGQILLIVRTIFSVQTFKELAIANAGSLKIHIIGGTKLKSSKKTLSKQISNIFLYYFNETNGDLQAYGFYSKNNSKPNNYCIVVGADGIIIEAGERTDFSQKVMLNWRNNKVIQTKLMMEDPHLIDFFESIPTCKQTLLIEQVIKGWDYNPIISVDYSYDCDYFEQNRKILTSAFLRLEIRQEHKQYTHYLTEKFANYEDNSNFHSTINYIKTFDVPSGSYCKDCGDELIYPYYYFPWSNSHYCCSCSEAEDHNQTIAMKRFALPENAILLRAPNPNIDWGKIGKSILPKSKQNFFSFCFTFWGSPQRRCQVCSSLTSVIYDCLGCNRLPGKYFFNNFNMCLDCTQIMIREKSPKKEELTQMFPLHKQNHTLFRIVLSAVDR